MLLYTAPILTFKKVIKEGSVGEFSCIPYILTLFTSLTYMWYSFPVVSSGWENLTLFIINIIGVNFEIAFISIYLWYAPNGKKKFVVVMVSSILAIFSITVLLSSIVMHTHHIRKLFVGSIGMVAGMSMYSSPLVAVKQVLRTKSVEFMPFNLSLFSFLASLIWLVYGILGRDPYIMLPNCVGCLAGILQLAVYCIYRRCKEASKLNDTEQTKNVQVATSHMYASTHKP
ncbi:hypothetical protein QOZ80_5BG0450040 [Eleusine coracana subsp. coracana]|nr:hypothetical protein QOZ80_5BG0450040 [Eleusine coracana subsp. coracana]